MIASIPSSFNMNHGNASFTASANNVHISIFSIVAITNSLNVNLSICITPHYLLFHFTCYFAFLFVPILAAHRLPRHRSFRFSFFVFRFSFFVVM